MKNLSLLFIIIAFAITACQESAAPVDIESEKATIKKMFAENWVFINNIEFDSVSVDLTEDVLSCGSDPSEFWNKKEIEEIWKSFTEENIPEMELIGDRIVKVAPDGQSAIVVEQVNLSYTPDIPWRTVYYLLKTNGKWMISFMSTALIPRNEDLEAISKSVAVEEEPVEE
ncbi:MAG: hypothetical protein ACQERS_14250 [Bacteroidota bacterium]